MIQTILSNENVKLWGHIHHNQYTSPARYMIIVKIIISKMYLPQEKYKSLRPIKFNVPIGNSRNFQESVWSNTYIC